GTIEDSDAEGSAGPSTSYAQRQSLAFDRLSQQFECAVCLEMFYATSIVVLPCRDRYCVGCLKQLFLRATRDEGAFPPRCCSQAIPIDSIKIELSEAELKAFHKAKVGYTSQDRTYCSEPRCGSFIPSSSIHAAKATCPDCRNQTYTMCKTKFHENGDCPADKDLHNTLELADEKGWQRCRSCRQMVELVTGCYHMRCKCGYEFCYECGKQWKTCPCQTADEGRMYARGRAASQPIDRDHGALY
ncbi:putative ariadne RING finger, partial [Lophiostoma macrostomum CBS 122681]